MYGKFFACAFTGSMMGAGSHVFAVWGYVIANTTNSQVDLNPKLLAALIGADERDIELAIEYLCAPDSKSNSKIEGGRRLVKVGQFSYRVPNHAAYRSIRDETDRQAYMRNYMREYRSVNRKTDVNSSVNSSKPRKPQLAHTEAEAEAEAEYRSTSPHSLAKAGERVHGIPKNAEEVVAYGKTITPIVPESRCRDTQISRSVSELKRGMTRWFDLPDGRAWTYQEEHAMCNVVSRPGYLEEFVSIQSFHSRDNGYFAKSTVSLLEKWDHFAQLGRSQEPRRNGKKSGGEKAVDRDLKEMQEIIDHYEKKP